MVLDLPVADLLAEIGHDGGEIVAEGHPEPQCRRGHHVQELITIALAKGYTVTPIELFPQILAPGKEVPVKFGESLTDNFLRFQNHMRTSKGTISGAGRTCEHMVAYDHGRIFDPDGREYDYSREACEMRGFFTRCVWRFDRIGQ